MAKYYSDYCWKKGKPVGIGETSLKNGEVFRIVTDPYHKRYSVEKYSKAVFHEVVYDSFLLDFRKINPQHQTAWQRELLIDNNDYQKCLIRDIDDRIILFEELFFEKNRCRICNIYSPHGIFVAVQRVLLLEAGDSFNGVTLADRLGKIIMYKKYSLRNDGEFEELLEECWDAHFSQIYTETHSKIGFMA